MELSFKQYLASKEKLREAIKQTPIQIIEYTVKRYSKLPIGESKATREYVALCPKQKIFVEWEYTNIDDTPTPLSVSFAGVRDLLEGEQHSVLWDGDKLQEWLSKNTAEVTKI